MDKVFVTVLGTGTSTGVPVPACTCETCTSTDPRDSRLRTSVYITIDGLNILIDTSTDLRQQALKYNLKQIDAVLFTHAHADHINGMDDLRGFNFASYRDGKDFCDIPIFAEPHTLERLKRVFDYVFTPDPNYQGGMLPKLVCNLIEKAHPFNIGRVTVTPLNAYHGELPVVGFRLGNFAYLTDCSTVPEETIDRMRGVDTLILDGLRERPHPTHLNFAGAISVIEHVRPRKSYLTHIAHEHKHEAGNMLLKQLTNLDVELAFDGLKFEVE